MLKVKRNDMVYVIAGRDKGKKGKVLRLISGEHRVIVEGINLVKKHKRRTQTDQQGGIVSLESPIEASNLMLLCKHCNRPVRVGLKTLNDGTKMRFCKKCKEVI
jgi:large subunit ribosomal protein L24